MATEYPQDSRFLSERSGRILRAAHKGIEEEELPAPKPTERAPLPPGRAEDEPDREHENPRDDDEIPNFYEKKDRDPDPSMHKGIPGPNVTPPNDEDI